jgi:predicted metal-binding membrane protein
LTDGALPALLRRDRAVVLSGLAAVVVLAWAYLLFGAGIKMEMISLGINFGYQSARAPAREADVSTRPLRAPPGHPVI